MKLIALLLVLISSSYGTEKIPTFRPDRHLKRQASSLQLTYLMGTVIDLDSFVYEDQEITTVRVSSIVHAFRLGSPPDSVAFCGDVKSEVRPLGRSVAIIYSKIMHRKNCYDILKIIDHDRERNYQSQEWN